MKEEINKILGCVFQKYCICFLMVLLSARECSISFIGEREIDSGINT